MSKTPTWHKEALQEGINYIVIIYSKAEGFVFCPSDLEHSFRVGGDYDGCIPTNANGALYHYSNYFNKAFTEQVRWFIPFVQKVANGADFSLQDLKIEERKLRVITGRWPW